jgi:signal peptidase I
VSPELAEVPPSLRAEGPEPEAGRAPAGPAPVAARDRIPRRVGRERTLTAACKLALPLLLASTLLFQLSVVRGASMSPGIHDGDRILIDPVRYWLGDVARGDIVVLRYPLDPRFDYIKRVIGLPGDEIRISRGRVRVNGRVLDEPYVVPDPETELSTRVSDGSYFVLGDNRPHSSDSREFGEVPHALLRGRVDLRLWPPGRLGPLE